MPRESFSANNKIDLITDQQLLILTELENTQVSFINTTGESYCGINNDLLQKNGICFYKEFVHPEDYPRYMNHLTSLNGNTEEKAIIRLKDKEGSWRAFSFMNRLYKGNHTGEKPIILSLAHKLNLDPAESADNDNFSHSPGYEILGNEYQHLLDSLDEGFCLLELIYDKDGLPVDYLYLKTNPAFEKQANLKDVIGKTIRELIPNPNQHWIDTFGKVAVKGESIRFQDVSSSLNNSWLDLYAFKVGSPESRQIGVLFRNITERKQAEEQLQQQLSQHHRKLQDTSALLQSVFDNTNLAIAVFKTLYEKDGSPKDFEFLRVNKVLRELYLDKDVVGHTYLETSKHGVKMGLFDAFKQIMRSGEALDKEFYFDKEEFNHWFRLTGRPHKDLLIITLEDITARKAEAQELEETMRFKEELGRATHETILIINLNNFNVRYINKDIFPEAGITKERVQGMSLEEILPFIHPRDREKVLDLHKKLLKSAADQILDAEVRLKLKGNSWEWFNVRGKIFHRRDETWVEEYVLLITNITDQKRTQRALIKAEALSIQGEAARTFAHELRNPLASIGMVREVLHQKLGDYQKEELSNYFDILKRSTVVLNDMVTNLLNASNYTPAVLREEDLGEIVSQTIYNAADRIYLAGIKVVKNFKGKYPILSDKEKLEIALMNIIVNASEATTPGKGIIQIDIEEHDTDFVLSIRDNGHGMEQEEIDRLFETFYTSKDSGVGVGMSSVKNILEEHDARIKVESLPGKGSCFLLFFHNLKIE